MFLSCMLLQISCLQMCTFSPLGAIKLGNYGNSNFKKYIFMTVSPCSNNWPKMSITPLKHKKKFLVLVDPLNFSRIVPEIFEMCNLWWNSLTHGRSEKISLCLFKNVVWISVNALSGMFQFLMILPIFLPMALSMCYLSWFRPLHFPSKSVEFFHASLNRLSLKDKLTLDLSHYIWKSVVGVRDIFCCKFFPIVNFSRIVPEIFEMCNLWWNSLKLGRSDQITQCMSSNIFSNLYTTR